MSTFDLVVQGGTLVDGTGRERRDADVGIVGERIVAVGSNLLAGGARAARVIDARGKLVTPGFVDIHTHYDAQATWDAEMTPSSNHGVTTAVMGSCGVGFAPVKPDEHEWLIGLMEGVEDIPGSALTEGLQWGWESFPEYLDTLAKLPRTIDVAAQLAHGPLRAYVMGQRGANNEPATAADRAHMQALAEQALRAGAVGVSTSRTSLHKANNGEVVPGTHADSDELFALADAIKAAGHGVFVAACEHKDVPDELAVLAALSRRSGGRVTVNLNQTEAHPHVWRDVLAGMARENSAGAQLAAQVAGRAIGLVMGLELSAHPLLLTSTYLQRLGEPLSDRVAALRDPAVREALIADEELDLGPLGELVLKSTDRLFVVEGDVDYEPDPQTSLAALAKRHGVSPRALALDAMLRDDGHGLLYRPLFNYADGNLDLVRELHLNPNTLMGLSDAGAHCGAICDGGMPTFMLSFWTRDRRRGERLPLEHVVRRQTRDTAHFFGLHDRGVIAPGLRADVNVIDYDRLGFAAPRVVYDLPANGRRLLQDAHGYVATICAGAVTVEDDRLTGARPGRLVRGPRVR
jgi:N-acyl-D-amino-acid deacylase